MSPVRSSEVPSLRADLLFEAGGVKGAALAGAYRELSDRGWTAQCVAGASGGAIIAALVAVGYSGAELEDIVMRQMDFRLFQDRGQATGVTGQLARFFRSRGFNSGSYFLGWIREKLEAKGISTFGQLHDAAADSPSRADRLQVIVSDLSSRRMLVLPRDAPALGMDPDELEIAIAVRMSMSVPIFFDPVLVKASDGEHAIVDGTLLSSFPIWLFDTRADVVPRFPTFGLLSVAPDQAAPATGSSPEFTTSQEDFLKAIAGVATGAHDRLHLSPSNAARTILIPTLGVDTTQFDVSPNQAQALFDSGRDAAARFFEGWDFEVYVTRWRTGPTRSRRSLVQSM